VNTAQTNVSGILSPSALDLPRLASEPPESGVPGSTGTEIMGNATPRGEGSKGETVAMPRHLLTPRGGLPVPPPPTPRPSGPMQTPSSGIPVMPLPQSSPSGNANARPNPLPTAALVVGTIALLGVLAVSIKIVKNNQSVPSATTAPATFEVSTKVSPESATIEIDGANAGTGVITRSFSRDGARHKLRAFAPGYEPAALEFDETTPPPPLLTLRAADEPSVPGSSPSSSARTKSGVSGRPGAVSRPGSKTDNIDPWQK